MKRSGAPCKAAIPRQSPDWRAIAAAGTNTQNSFALLQSLRAQEAQAKAQLAESGKRYGANWPAVAEQRARVETLDKSIQEEIAPSRRSRPHRLRGLCPGRELCPRRLQPAKGTCLAPDRRRRGFAPGAPGGRPEPRPLRQPADPPRANRCARRSPLRQLRRCQPRAGSAVRITPPAPTCPCWPRWLWWPGIGVGSAAAIARELTDNTIRTAADLESLLDTPVFATLPSPAGSRPWYRRLLPAPASATPGAGGGDRLRHRLRCSAVSCSRRPFTACGPRCSSPTAGAPPQVITVTGPRTGPTVPTARSPTEKRISSLALSLAAVLAQYGAPVLYIDADLRSAPRPPAPCRSARDSAISSPAIGRPTTRIRMQAPPLLSVLSSGARPPCPAELIASSRMQQFLSQMPRGVQLYRHRQPAGAFR